MDGVVEVVEGDVAAHQGEHGGLVGDEEGVGEDAAEGEGQGEADETAAGAEFEAGSGWSGL